MVDLAFHFGEPRTTQQISRATQIPADYLAKIMQDLNKHDLVRSQRGPGGGFSLSRDPDRISVYDVLDSVDPVRRIRTCPLNLKAHSHALCPLHRRLDDVMAQCEAVFRKTSIADITAEPDPARPSTSRPSTLTISGGLRVTPPRRGSARG